MALIDELKEQRIKASVALEKELELLSSFEQSVAELRGMIADITVAIAALEPAPADEPELFDDEPREYISELTGDPCVEPESGLHGEPIEEAPAPQLQSGYDLYAEHLAAVAAMDEAPALNEAMQDEREQGYAPVTNPEADAIARAHDYYSPEKIAARNRSVFSIFRRETEEV
jgi:hypothetical protein